MLVTLGRGLCATTSRKRFVDLEWLKTQDTSVPLISLSRTAYRQTSWMQGVRDNAGVQNGETAGNVSGSTIGLTGAQSTSTSIAITSEVNASSLASSGTGVAGDPYIIRDLDITTPGFSQCLRINDSDANYTIKFVNCTFAEGNTQEIYIDGWPSKNVIEFENCKIYDAAAKGNTYSIRWIAGSLKFTNTLFAGDSAIQIIGATTAAHSGTLELDNCLINESEANITGIFFNPTVNTAIDITLTNVELDVDPTRASGRMFNLEKSIGALQISNCAFTGMRNILGANLATSAKLDGLIIRNSKFTDQYQEPFVHNYCHNALIEHCEFTHNAAVAANYRQAYFRGDDNARKVASDNNTVRYCKFTKKSGSGAGNECLESERGTGNKFQYCYVTECTEDAFEHVLSRGANTIEWCVADNCVGQAADIYRSLDASSWTQITDSTTSTPMNVYVHHIYGDCAMQIVTIDSICGVVAHDIYGNNLNCANSFTAPVMVNGRDSYPCKDIYISGPLPLSADSGESAGEVFKFTKVVEGCEVRYRDESGNLICYTGNNAPTNSVSPIISGAGAVGNTLSVTSNGTWSADVDYYQYQWMKNGAPVVNQIGTTYIVQAGDSGSNIQCYVYGSSVHGGNEAQSNVIAIS